MRVDVTPRALADRDRIFRYLARRSSEGATNVMQRIETAFNRLGRDGDIGHPTDVPGVSVLFVGEYPYLVFYRMRRDGVEITHVRHTSQKSWSGF